MGKAKVTWAVFTKPWQKMSLPELGRFVHDLGFDGIELPARPGYQVEPENVARDLPEAVKILGDFGVRITSVTGPEDEAALAAYGAAGIPILRGMISDHPDGYQATLDNCRKRHDEMLPLLMKHGVKLGLQNHVGGYFCNASGLYNLVKDYDPKHIGAVLCLGHCSLQGEGIKQALDIVWPHLAMIFMKNAFWYRVTHPEDKVAQWGIHWTTGRQGLSHWPTIAKELNERGFDGCINLNAEYSDEARVGEFIAEDIVFAKSLFA